MDQTLQTVVVSVLATWLGAIGIGLISVGLRLNNTVQRLGVVVRLLVRQNASHARDIELLKQQWRRNQAPLNRRNS